MPLRRAVAVLTAVAAVLALGGAPPVLAAASAPPVEAREGTLTVRAVDAGTGQYRLASARVRQDLRGSRLTGTFVLDAEPVGRPSWPYLRVTFGHDDGDGQCRGDVEVSTRTGGPLSPGFTRSFKTLTLSVAEPQAGYETWDCAFAAVDRDLDPDPSSTYSLLGGVLHDVHAQPALAVGAPTLLGAKRIALVRGVWTTLEVPVRNTGRAEAGRVTVTGSGAGVKVAGTRSASPLAADSATTLRVRVKLTGAKASTKLRLVAKAAGETARRTVTVRRAAAPARPRPGRYVPTGDSEPTLSFRIDRKGRVSGFRVRSSTRCGGFPAPVTYADTWYDFPTSKIPRNGIVDRRQQGRLFTAALRLQVRGGTVTRGHFAYRGPDRCVASEAFTARRAPG